MKGGAAIAGRRVFFGDDMGIVHALDLATGKELWTFKTEGPIEATPLVLGGVCTSARATLSSTRSTPRREQKWKYETGDKILGGANHVDGPDGERMLIGSYDNNLHCVDAATGKLVWKLRRIITSTARPR